VSDAPTRLERLGHLVRSRRGRLGYDLEPLAKKLSMGKETLRAVERGDRRARTRVYGAVENALGWPEGSIEAYLDERGPEPSAPGDIVMYEPEAGGPTSATVPRDIADDLAELDDHGRAIIEAAIRAALEHQRARETPP
jgi:hypothetical protein